MFRQSSSVNDVDRASRAGIEAAEPSGSALASRSSVSMTRGKRWCFSLGRKC